MNANDVGAVANAQQNDPKLASDANSWLPLSAIPVLSLSLCVYVCYMLHHIGWCRLLLCRALASRRASVYSAHQPQLRMRMM